MTWELYIKQRWGLSKMQANNLITAAEVIQDLKSQGVPEDKLPTSAKAANRVKKAAKKTTGKKTPTPAELKEANTDEIKSPRSARPNGNKSTVDFTYNRNTYEATVLKTWEDETRKFAKEGVDATAMVQDTIGRANTWLKAYTTVKGKEVITA
jgi:hypothetical protein